MRRRSGIEPVIGHLKHDGHLERNHLAGPEGDAINAILSAAGQNMRLLIRWLRLLWLCFLASLVDHNRKPEASFSNRCRSQSKFDAIVRKSQTTSLPLVCQVAGRRNIDRGQPTPSDVGSRGAGSRGQSDGGGDRHPIRQDHGKRRPSRLRCPSRRMFHSPARQRA